MKRALLLQLPVPDFAPAPADANLPLAAGCLAALAARRAPQWRVELLPSDLADRLGDEALFRAMLEREPALVGFSLYLWNSERSLALGKRLRDAGVRVVAGGPEVTPDNAWLTQAGGADVLLAGEGEEAFCGLLASFPAAPPPPAAPPDLARLPSPYLSGVLNPAAVEGSARLETLRGCPFGCDYCRYGKGLGEVRAFPEAWLADHLAWFRAAGTREVYLMDPSFNVRAGWERMLSTLETANADGFFRFHTELAADRLRPGDAARLARAGLATCEVGLQSIHPDALARVGRRWDRDRWTSGTRALLDAGVAASVGLIAGLPGDTLEGLGQSLDFVLGELPGAGIQLFPLAVLPGTALRARAGAEGLRHHLLPPYTVTETRQMSGEELRAAFALFEERTGLEHDAPGPPPLWGPWVGGEAAPCLTGARLSGAGAPDGWERTLARRAANRFTLLVDGWSDALLPALVRLGESLRHGVLTLAFSAPLPSPDTLRTLRGLLPENPYLARHHAFSRHGLRLPRLVVLLEEHEFPQEERREAYRENAELVWRVEGADPRAARERAERLALAGETALLTGDALPDDPQAWARRLGPDAVGILLWGAEAQRKWEDCAGLAPCVASEARITLP